MRFRARYLGNILLVVISLLIAAALGEIFLRLLKPQIFDVHPQGMYVADEALGYALKPGFEGVIERSEFRAPFTVDDTGLRGAGPRPRADNSFRILVLGDSQAFGFGVLDNETFSAQLEEILAARYRNLEVQVLNGGVPGYGTADQLAFLRSKGGAFEPDLVILQFLSVNDIVESNAPAIDWAVLQDGWLRAGPQEPDGGGESPNLSERIRQLKQQSHLLHLLSNSAGYLALRLGLIDKIESLWGEDFTDDEGKVAAGVLVEISEEARRLGAPSLFLYSTAKNYVLSDDYELPRSGLVVRDAAETADVPWVDANETLRLRPDRTELYFTLDGHWSPDGHRAIAELLADELATLGLIGAEPGD